ncbi:hypothetical protein KGQ71_02060 [Patescibacteria group bacterium]|nr:hypothetical protein [Patescibacteria group bacterium]
MKHIVVGIIEQTNQDGEPEYLLVSAERAEFGEYSGAFSKSTYFLQS